MGPGDVGYIYIYTTKVRIVEAFHSMEHRVV